MGSTSIVDPNVLARSGYRFLQNVKPPQYLEPNNKNSKHGGFPYYHPLSGLGGSIAPGAQYPIHPPAALTYPKHVMKTTYRKSYQPNQVMQKTSVDRNHPQTASRGNTGTGYRFSSRTFPSLGHDANDFNTMYSLEYIPSVDHEPFQFDSGKARTPRW